MRKKLVNLIAPIGRNNQQGLTLVEILAAIAISSFLIVIVSSMLYTGLNSGKAVEDKNALLQQGHALSANLQNEWNKAAFDGIQVVEMNTTEVDGVDIVEKLHAKLLKFDYALATLEKGDPPTTTTFDWVRQKDVEVVREIIFDAQLKELNFYDGPQNDNPDPSKLLYSSKILDDSIQIQEIKMGIARSNYPSVRIKQDNDQYISCYTDGVFVVRITLATTSGFTQTFTVNLSL